MPKEEKLRKKAQRILDRAENYLTNEQYDRSAKEFLKAANQYFGLEEYNIAEQCYFYCAKALVHETRYLEASNFMRDSANCCVLNMNYSKAGDYYDISAKYALKSKKKESEFHSILSACFAYLCWFLQGQQDKGLAYIKRIKQNVDSKEFAENNLVRLVKGLTLAILNKDDSTLEVLKSDFNKYKFNEAETKLIKNTFLMAKTHLLLSFNLKLEKNEILNEKNLIFFLIIDISRLKELEHDDFLQYKFDSLKVIDAGVTLSENLSIKNKPILPIQGKEDKLELGFSARANFPGEAFVGPIKFTIELDDKFLISENTKSYKIMIKSPPSVLGINLRPMVNPIINQTFPMEIKINNPSDADAINITIGFEFPKSLRLMRGTIQKKIYQLIRYEEFKWQLSLKPLEPGTHIIKATVSFNDQDGNQIGPNTAELPFEINL